MKAKLPGDFPPHSKHAWTYSSYDFVMSRQALRPLSQVPATMDREEDFGLSSGDEATLLQVEEANPLKRKSDQQLGSTSKAARTGDGDFLTSQLANEVLRQRFRINSFRLKQEAAIDRLLQGDSAVVVFPTGSLPFVAVFDHR